MLQIDRAALKARNRLIAMFLLLCIIDVALVGMAQDRWAIARLLLTVIVMYFVVQGRKWAKWLLVGIFSLLVVILIAMIFVLSSRLSTTLLVGSSILAVLSAVTATYMVTSQDLNRYFSFKRRVYSR